MGNTTWSDVESPKCWVILGICAIENGSLCIMTRSMGVPGDGIGLDVNHIEWYRLRVRFASIMCMV